MTPTANLSPRNHFTMWRVDARLTTGLPLSDATQDADAASIEAGGDGRQWLNCWRGCEDGISSKPRW
jgi:hypothetical protein